MNRTFQHITARWLPGILFMAFTLSSCQKTDPQTDALSMQKSRQTKEDITFISSLGYDTDDIEKTDDGYLVEGDIWLTGEWLEAARQQPQTRLNELPGSYKVDQQYHNKLYLSYNSVPSTWNNTMLEAMKEWNDLKNCYIHITNIPGGDLQEITIEFGEKFYFDNNTSKLMKVTPPANGKPGRVMINSDCMNLPNISDITNATVQTKAVSLIMHAIGHALGLGHTAELSGEYDAESGGHITGTRDYDNQSIMRKEGRSLPWNRFSDTDKKDIPAVFPIPLFNPGSIERTKILDQETGYFTILSTADAFSGTGTITYIWEQKVNGKWTTLSGQTKKDLTNAPVPTELTTEYRRKASSGTDEDYSNTCVVTNSTCKPIEPGSIAESVLIDTTNLGEQLTISSVKAAVCPRDEVSYSWEVKQGDSWTVIPSATSATLVTTAPTQFTTVYKRKASCQHWEGKYSNECTVYNKSFLDAGAIPELVETNKTGFNLRLNIPSLRAASLPRPSYSWEIDNGNGWKGSISQEESITGLFYQDWAISVQRLIKLRRRVTTPFGPAYTNECTLINYAFREDPQQGTNMKDNPIPLGTYGQNFTITRAVDTRSEYFRDIDRLQYCGNDAFMELEITRRMYVAIITSAMPMSVWLDVWDVNDTFDSLYSGVLSGPLADLWTEAEYVPFPTLDDINRYPEWIGVVDLHPGKYLIQLQGRKHYNSGTDNHVISITLQGDTGPEPEPVPGR